MRKGFKSFLVDFGKFLAFYLAVEVLVRLFAWFWDDPLVEIKAEAAFAWPVAAMYILAWRP